MNSHPVMDLEKLINHAMIILGLAMKMNESKVKKLKHRAIDEHYKMLHLLINNNSSKASPCILKQEFEILAQLNFRLER